MKAPHFYEQGRIAFKSGLARMPITKPPEQTRLRHGHYRSKGDKRLWWPLAKTISLHSRVTMHGQSMMPTLTLARKNISSPIIYPVLNNNAHRSSSKRVMLITYLKV